MMKWTTLLAYGLGLCSSIANNRLASAFVVPRGIIYNRSQPASTSRALFRNHDHAALPLRRSTTMLQEQRGGNTRSFADSVRAALTSAAIGLALAGPMVSLPGGAAAAGKRMVGEISASGLIFKDKLNVEAFSDPKVKGVTLYLSDFSRPVADKLINGDIFSDPSSAGLFCVRSGPVEVSETLKPSKEGEELFKEDRSFFKSIVVRRLYDKEANNVVYVSYSSKLDAASDGNKSRFKSSLCAVHIE